MKIRYLGEIVRQRREELDVSQKMVCEGLCTPMTLSRFESGQQTPSWDCVVAILQRLGLPDDRYCIQLTRKEARLVRLRREVLACCNQFEQASENERQQARVNALKKLRDLERRIRKDDQINQQFVLRVRATLETYSPKKQLEVLMKAIRLTAPQLDLEEIGRCLYSTNEIAIIDKIAVRYSLCGQFRKAIDIYGQLLKFILKRVPNHSRLPLIAYNYARCLAMENRLEEALEISALGRQSCIEQGNYAVLPGLLHIEAGCCYFMGETGRSMELYRSTYHIYGAVMDVHNQNILRDEAKTRFNLVLYSPGISSRGSGHSIPFG